MGANVVGVIWFSWTLWMGLLPGYDAFAYWSVDLDHLYPTSTLIYTGAYRYSPVFAQLIDPFGAVPWVWFFFAFLVVDLLALTVLGGRWALALLLIPSVTAEVHLANIDLLLALAVPAGLVFPPAWIALALTKLTPAIIVLWFAARGEWRSFLIVVLGTLAIALPSLVLTPGLWADWYRISTQLAGGSFGASEISPIPRLIAAAVIVVIGARRSWRWTLAVAAVLGMPGLDFKTATIGLSILPLYGLGMLADWPAIRARLGLRRGAAEAAPAT